MSQQDMGDGEDLLSSASKKSGLGSAFVEQLVRWLGDELYRDRYAQLERTGGNKEDGIPLARVFVDLKVSRRLPVSDRTPGAFRFVRHFSRTALRREPDPSSHDVEESSSPEDSLDEPRRRSLRSRGRAAHRGHVVIGGPGQGKSTLCQLLCQVHRAWLLLPHASRLGPGARALMDEMTRRDTDYPRPAELRVPIAIVLPEAAAWLATQPDGGDTGDRVPRLLAYVEERARKRGTAISAAGLLALLGACDWLLVLDGLDEVPVTAGRDVLLREIDALLRALDGYSSHGLVLATTRPQGYSGELRGRVSDEELHLVWLDVPTALKYAEKLADTRYASTPEQREKVITRLKQAAEQGTTARLMRTPLQVTIMAALVDSVGRAPGERWSLFSEYYRVAYDRERERFESSPLTRDIAEVLRQYRRHIDKVHAQVALLLHVEGEHAGGTESSLSMERFNEVVENVLVEDEIDAARRAELSSQLRRAVTERLVLLSERSPGQVRFDVRAMQEFFTANALAARGEDTLMQRVLQVARATSFRQVLLFLASKAFSDLSDLRNFFAGKLCEHLDDDDDVLVRATRPGAVLALEMLEDGAAIKQTKYVRRLAERAVTLLDRSPTDLHVRLARAALLDPDAATDIQPVLEGAIAARLKTGSPIDRLGAWVALLTLVERDEGWATALAETAWPEMRGRYVEALRAVIDTGCPLSAWLDAHLARCLEEITPADVRPLAQHRRYRAVEIPASVINSSFIHFPGKNCEFVYQSRITGLGIEYHNTFVDGSIVQRLYPIHALEEIPSSWLTLALAARLIQSPTPETLATALDLVAESWKNGPLQGSTRLDLPWPLAACLAAADSSDALKSLAKKAREGALGSADDWFAAEEAWNNRDTIALEDALGDPGARWPLSETLSRSVIPVLAASRLWFGHPFGGWIDFVLSRLSSEPSAPIRAFWYDLIQDSALQRLQFDEETGGSLTSVDIEQIWEHTHTPFLETVAASHPWHKDPSEWANLVHRFGTRGTLQINYSQVPRLAPWLAEMYSRDPTREGLVNALMLLATTGQSAPLDSKLLAPERFSSQRLAAEARLLGLAQPWMTPEGAEAQIRAIATLESPAYPLSLAVRIVENLPDDSPARAAALATLWELLPREQWQNREATREAAVSALQRTSGLDEPRIWDQLHFSLPRPVIPTRDKRPSDRPEPRPVHIGAIRFQNLRIFANFELLPVKPQNGDGQCIVIVGANGRGKTTLLRGVALALVDVISQPNRLPRRAFEMTWRRSGAPSSAPVALSVEVNGQTFSAQFSYDEDRDHQPRFTQMMDSDRAVLPPVFGYGCRRGSALGGARKQIEDQPGTELYTLFDEALDLTHAETWLTFREIEALKEREQNPDGPASRIYAAVKVAFLELFDMELLGTRGGQVFIKHKMMGEMPIGALSDGYLTMMGWIIDLLAKWIRRRRSFEQIDKGFTKTMTGLVLIDEIDLHIHPAWQKDILRKVREFFPKMSFIVTTHNPFTLLGARAEEIWVLRPDEEGLIRADQGKEQPALLTAAAIYEAYFENPRDFPHGIGADFHRYEALAASPIRSDEEETEVQSLLVRLRKAGHDPGWKPVPREEIPPYPGDEGSEGDGSL